jgi:invasion protein IalB
MRILPVLLVILTLAFAVPVHAADKTAPAAAPASAAANVKSKPAASVWAVRCDDPKAGNPRHCEIFQRLSLTKKGSKDPQRLAEFAIGYKADGKKKDAQGILILPLGVLVTEPVDIEIDEKKDFTAQIRYCDGGGCYAFADIPAGMLDRLSKGDKFTVKARAANGKNFHIVMSLAGFSKALEQIKLP